MVCDDWLIVVIVPYVGSENHKNNTQKQFNITMITQIGSSICKYMWEHSTTYENNFYTASLKSGIEIRSRGYVSEDDDNMIIASEVIVNSVNYCGNTMMHSTPKQYEKSLQSVHAKSQNISIHVIAVADMENAPIVALPPVGVVIFALIPRELFTKYFALSNSAGTICGKHFSSLNTLSKLMIVEGTFVSRLQHKCEHLENWHNINGQNWMNTLLFSIFDSVQIATKNRRLFVRLIMELKGYMVIQSIKSIESMEALLLGCAGLLENAEYPDAYLYDLRIEFNKLAKMNGITKLNSYHWATTVGNVPIHLVMVQLASILFNNKTFLYSLIESSSLSQIRKLFQTEVTEYWLTHYELGVSDKKKHRSKKMSDSKIDIILINGILPFVALYSKVNNLHIVDMEKIIDFYIDIESESNMFITQWEQNGVEFNSAFETQAFIELSKNYCTPKLCYCCPIGKKMLR